MISNCYNHIADGDDNADSDNVDDDGDNAADDDDRHDDDV